MATPGSKIGLDPQQFPRQREFVLAGDPHAIEPVVEAILEFISSTGAAAGKEGEITLALQEALANAVVHGCNGDVHKTVHCAVGCDTANGVLIVVRDPGPGFDPGKVRSPLSKEGLSSNHGRGIHMIREFMDEVRYERNGTELHMRKK